MQDTAKTSSSLYCKVVSGVSQVSFKCFLTKVGMWKELTESKSGLVVSSGSSVHRTSPSSSWGKSGIIHKQRISVEVKGGLQGPRVGSIGKHVPRKGARSVWCAGVRVLRAA